LALFMNVRAISIALLLALALGCERNNAHDLLFVSLDTVRRDHLPTYGYGRATAPRIDALAQRSGVFENAFAQHVNTHPSHASMFTGLYPHVHGSMINGQILRREPWTLAQILRETGFRTAAFVSGATMLASTGLDRGFVDYDDAITGLRRPGRETALRAVKWLRALPDDERFFLVVHLFDAHGPYRPPASHTDRFRAPDPGPVLDHIPHYQRLSDPEGRPRVHLNGYVDRYDATIRYQDDQVGLLLDAVDLDRSVVVVLSDHGETLGERYHPLDHGARVFDEQIRIPLIVHAPGLEPRRVQELVQTVDLLPTLLELLQVPAPLDLEVHGRSLVPLLREQRVEPLSVFSSAVTLPKRYDRSYRLKPGRQLHALRTERWKLIVYPGVEEDYVELYDLERDPGETRNRADTEPQIRDELHAQLRQWLALGRPQAAPEVSPGLRRYLEDLGYVIP
jgi:arylsulfatase A-like enzyme